MYVAITIGLGAFGDAPSHSLPRPRVPSKLTKVFWSSTIIKPASLFVNLEFICFQMMGIFMIFMISFIYIFQYPYYAIIQNLHKIPSRHPPMVCVLFGVYIFTVPSKVLYVRR